MRARNRHFSYRSAGASLAFDSRYIQGVSDNTTIQTWSDLSGNGRNATQATAANRATYRTNVQGGNAILRFDGNDNYAAPYVTGTAFSLYCISKRTASNINAFSNVTFIASTGIESNTGSGRRYQICYDDTNNFYFSSNIGSANSIDQVQPRNNNFNLHSVSAAIGSGNSVYLLNGGNAQTASAAALQGVTSGTVRMVIGATSWNASLIFNGDMGMLVAYETAHTNSLRRRIEHSAAFSFKLTCN